MKRRRVLVTGASRGIGRGLVVRLLANGDQVIGCGRSEWPPDFPAAATYVQADVANEADVKHLFTAIRREAGGLDVLVNNAGVARMNLLALTPGADVRHIIDANLLGVVYCSQRAIRLLRHSDAPRIVNMTTVAVPLRLEGEAIYAASKAAVETLTRITARELGPMGITCNAIGPSPIRTALVAGVATEKLDALVARQAITEWASTDDVYNVLDFFLRPESRMVTGQVVYLGGIS